MRPGGILAVITPSSFLADDYVRSHRETIAESFGFLGQVALSSGVFPVSIETKVSFWFRRSEYLADVPFSNDFQTWASMNRVIRAFRDERQCLRAQLDREARRAHVVQHDFAFSRSRGPEKEPQGFMFRVTKMMFEVARHYPENLGKARVILQQLEEEKPRNLARELWEERRMTESKALAALRALYARKPAARRTIRTGKHADRLTRADEQLMVPMKALSRDPRLEAWLERYRQGDLMLTDVQRADLGLMIRKRVGYLQWEQGSGKTVAAIALLHYRLEHGQIDQAVIAGPALAIRGTWCEALASSSYPFTVIDRLADLERRQGKGLFLITLDMLVKYRRQLARWAKTRRKRLQVILDEADEISNLSSARTRAVLQALSVARYKLCLSGTMTRNNLAESFPQLYFLAGGTRAFLCDAAQVYEQGKDGELIARENPSCGEPFPAWKKGLALFKACFSPSRVTVFGLEKRDQSIVNGDALEQICSRFVLVRRFDEIKGCSLARVEHEPCTMRPESTELYRRAREQFDSLRRRFFKSQGVARKDAALRIIQQINLLLTISSSPELFPEVGGSSSKTARVLQLIEGHRDHVAIGVTRHEVARHYAAAVRKRFPDRPVILITGNEPIRARLNRIERLGRERRGVIVATQQSLACSANIDWIDLVILPQLQWSIARMSQFWMRFVRFTSKRRKRIVFVTYSHTIEANLLLLLGAKEKLNRFLKGDPDLDLLDLLEELGIDQLEVETRSVDRDGLVSWGSSRIA